MLQEKELRRERFGNGLVLIADPTKSVESVTFAGSIKSGTIFDQEGKFGTAELVSRVLMRGAAAMTRSEISERVEEVGATLQFSNYDESVSFTARCHSDYVDRLLKVLSDCISHPSFSSEEVEKARSEIIADLEAERDETRSMAYREIIGLIYGKEKPYGRNTLGTMEDVAKLNRDDVARFYEEFYNSDSLILAASGSFEFDALSAAVEDTLGSWDKKAKNKNYIGRNEQDIPPKPSLRTYPMEHKSQVDLALGARAVQRGSEEYYALNLGNLMLGRIGLYGRLGKNVRDEKGLAYYCFSVLQARQFAGHIAVFAGVNPKNIERAVESIGKELQRICTEPLSGEEMSKAKKNLKGSLSIALESPSERVSIFHDLEYYGLGLDYLQRYPLILDSLTSEKVLDSCEKYLSPSKVSVAAAGPIGSHDLSLPATLAS